VPGFPGALVVTARDRYSNANRHRYEFNNHYLEELDRGRLELFRDSRADGLVEFIELRLAIPGSWRSQFHPGIHLDASRRAIPSLRDSFERPASIAPLCSPGRRDRMRLALFRGSGPSARFFLICRSLRRRKRGALVLDVAGPLEGNHGQARRPRSSSRPHSIRPNRSSRASFRGPGNRCGSESAVPRCRAEIGVPVLTDVHEDTPLADRGGPSSMSCRRRAFLCRQTNFIRRRVVAGQARETSRRDSSCHPGKCKNVVDKARSTGKRRHHGLRARVLLRIQQSGVGHALPSPSCAARDVRWVFDATHSVQLPGGKGDVSGGPARIRAGTGRVAAVAAGIARIIHGDASRSGESLVGRPECPGPWIAWPRSWPRSRNWTRR